MLRLAECPANEYTRMRVWSPAFRRKAIEAHQRFHLKAVFRAIFAFHRQYKNTNIY
jgi:hypothetical protein